MSGLEAFKERVARTEVSAKTQRRRRIRDDARNSVIETLFEAISDIVIFGWWTFFGGIAFFLFAVFAVLNFLGFGVEFFLGASFVLMLAVALAAYMWES